MNGAVVVGASLAGAHAALALRRLGYASPITLVGAEARLPYERPELSKAFLAGELAEERLLVATAAEYEAQGITLRLGSAATGVDVDRRTVTVEGDEIPYDAAVIATGSANVRPRLPGIELPGVLQLRTLDESIALRTAASEATKAVVVGMGLVGCEVAATLVGLGLEVTAVDTLPGPLWAALGPELSAVVRLWHEQQGVELIGGVGVAALEGGDAVERVVLADGRAIAADLVVVGVGARGNVEWLRDSALHLDSGGVGVDQLLRTSAENVYAAGDVAAVWDAPGGRHRRTEHYMSAIDQANRVAHQVAGLESPAPAPSWFWSYQYGRHLQYAGERGPDDLLLKRADPFAWFFLRSGILTAAATVDNSRDLRRSLSLLGRPVDVRLLSDATVDLRQVAGG